MPTPRSTRRALLAARSGAVALLLFAVSVAAHPQGGSPVQMTWNTLDGGGGRATGDSFILVGTIGQADAGTSSGGAFTLRGGFWPGPSEARSDCPGDFDRNGAIDASDLAVMLGGWGPTTDGDIDLVPDGVIDASDLAVLLGGWGACPNR